MNAVLYAFVDMKIIVWNELATEVKDRSLCYSLIFIKCRNIGFFINLNTLTFLLASSESAYAAEFASLWKLKL